MRIITAYAIGFSYEHPSTHPGFTLIELSIVLVVIGLIIGGVLVGRDLIQAAQVRATIAQIEKFNTAANTFRDKYGYLPGDIKDPEASSFGFQARGQYAGEGDGNGIIEGLQANHSSNNCGAHVGGGESGVFWSDLSAAHLIDGGFTAATATTNPGVTAPLDNYLPSAKLGNGNYIYVWSGGFGGVPSAGHNESPDCGTSGDGTNYFGIEAMTQIGGAGVLAANSPGLTAKQAYAIDTKIDDGNPQYGAVRALFFNFNVAFDSPVWAAGGGTQGAYQFMGGGALAPTTAATPGSSTTCYDNSSSASGTPGVSGAVQHYSIEINNGSNVNCALSFRFQ